MGFENGKLVRVTLRATLGAREEVNTFHYDLVDSSIPGNAANDPQELADRFRDDVRPTWASLYRSRWTLDPVVVTEELDPQNPHAPRSQWTSGSATAGTRASGSDLLPSAVCWVAALKSDNIGRRFNGRNFVGGDIDEGAQSDGAWVSGAMTEWNAAMADVPFQPDIASGASASTADWCVYSRTQRAADLDPYAAHITAVVVRPQVYWRRKRAGI